MAEPYLGEIHMFGGNFAQRGWATCDGATISIAQNNALFSLLGTYYGGNGVNAFTLPDLRGRIPIHQGTNPSNGITYNLAERGGSEAVAVGLAELPTHTHTVNGSADAASTRTPAGSVPAAAARAIYAPTGTPVPMASGVVGYTGAGAAHANVMPFLCLTYIIAVEGVYPTRS